MLGRHSGVARSCLADARPRLCRRSRASLSAARAPSCASSAARVPHERRLRRRKGARQRSCPSSDPSFSHRRRPWRGRSCQRDCSCRKEARHASRKVTSGDPCELRSCPRVALGAEVRLGPNLLGQSWPKSDQVLPTFAQSAILIESCQVRAEFGEAWAAHGPDWSDVANLKPNLV